MAERTMRPPIRPRVPHFRFDGSIPRHWLGGHPVVTHIANGVNLLFPVGERFFIRSVAAFVDRIADPALREAVKGFAGQEGQHAQAHEKFFDVLSAQGYPVGAFLDAYERIAHHIIERSSPPDVRLATTAALEHFTAILAADTLSRRLLDHAHPAVRDLMMWHAAEELEHKCVAYDLLQSVNSSYFLRLRGLVTAVLCLGGFWASATLMLLLQDRRMGVRSGPADPRVETHLLREVFWPGIREYVQRDFHPAQRDDLHLAREVLAQAGLT